MIPAALACMIGAWSAAATDIPNAATKARDWLLSVRYANGLLNSQADLPQVSYTYDNAVAACAFLALGDTANARLVLAGIQSLQDTSGAWFTAYDSKGRVVDGKQKWIGPCAWVVIAMARYREATGSTRFDSSARACIAWELRCRNADGTLWTYSVDDKATYTSTEENQDAYAGLKAFGYVSEASKIRAYLIGAADGQAWDAPNHRWVAGPDVDKSDLSYIFSDVNSWGVLALGSDGPAGWQQALDFNLVHHHATVTSKGITGQGTSFGSDTGDIWLEGTGQMAVAWNFVGDTVSGSTCAQQIALWQTADGGIPYSVLGGPTGDGWNMPTSASVSATAWFVLAARQVNPFAPLPSTSTGIARRIHVPKPGRSAFGPSDIQGRRLVSGTVTPRRRLPVSQATAGSTWSNPPSVP